MTKTESDARRSGPLATLAIALMVMACVTTPPSARPAGRLSSGSPAASAAQSARSPQPADVALQTIADGLVAPIGLVTPPDGGDRSFVVDQTGKILILDAGKILSTPFLDISDRIVKLAPDYDERGLLGLAFHPDFATNGRFFVYYSAVLRAGGATGQDHTDRLVEFHVSAIDPNRADPASGRTILAFEQPQASHNGGGLGFGPDGFLYLGIGDGGGAGDADAGHSPGGNAQDTGKLNGKILRIDVNGAKPYEIPPDNPFAAGGGRPEIYAYGFRNPWRLTWEPSGQRRLLVSDVGYGRYEEIDAVERGGNYGWRIREGNHCLDVLDPLADLADCPTTGGRGEPLIAPVVEYSHDEVGIAVVGGYVYRGSAIPALIGQYVFADFSRNWTTLVPAPRATLLAAVPQGTAGSAWPWRKLVVESGTIENFITGMGEDASGELYVLVRHEQGPIGQTGEILKVVPVSRAG